MDATSIEVRDPSVEPAPSRGARWAVLGFGVTTYVAFLVVFTYAIAWLDGLPVPFSLDGGTRHGLASSLAVDLSLVALFGIQHTVMARRSFKRALARVAPDAVERSCFVLGATLTFAAVLVFWRPLPEPLWHVEAPAARVALYVLQGLGWIGVLASTFSISHADLFGLRQVHAFYRATPYEAPPFDEPWLYRQVRHPMMLALLIAFWATPDASVGRVLFAGSMTVYVWIGLVFEERALVRELGDDYRAYQRRVPRLLPNPFRGRS